MVVVVSIILVSGLAAWMGLAMRTVDGAIAAAGDGMADRQVDFAGFIDLDRVMA